MALWIGNLWVGAVSANILSYDTTWTLVYDGGKTKVGSVIWDKFSDVKVLPNGESVCVGLTQDSLRTANVLVMKISVSGNITAKNLYTFRRGALGSSLLIAKNGDYVIGGSRYGAPLLLRLDSSLTLKASTWYYDSIPDRPILSQSATINSMFESSDGSIFTAAGDEFPDNSGQALNNYAAFLKFDSLGNQTLVNEWNAVTGYEIAGWSIAPGTTNGFMLGGNQAVFYIDNTGNVISKNQYNFSLPGVGTEVNNVMHVRRLANGKLISVGQSYEEDCWTRYQRLYYDAWWSPISSSGNDDFRYVAGVSGANDIVYDATQLLGGNLVFVGRKQSFDQIGGVWAFVTDSTGKNIIWEKQLRIPYRSSDGSALTPYSVAASPDSGFTVVGQNLLTDSLGAKNAFAAHFVPKYSTTVFAMTRAKNIRQARIGKDWVFSFDSPYATDVELKIFTVQGEMTARYLHHMQSSGAGHLKVGTSQMKVGIYLWQIRAGNETSKGFFALAH